MPNINNNFFCEMGVKRKRQKGVMNFLYFILYISIFFNENALLYYIYKIYN